MSPHPRTQVKRLCLLGEEAALAGIAVQARALGLRETAPREAMPGGLAVPLEGGEDGQEALRRELARRAGEDAGLYAAALATPGFCRLDRPGLLVADMDATLALGESIDEMARLWGCGDEVAAITERAMRGELDFAASLRQRVRAFAGMPLEMLEEVRDAARPAPGAEALVAGLRARGRGWKTAVASGGFSRIVEPFADRLGLDAAFCNRLAVEGGKLTGELEGELLDARGKRRVLEGLALRHGIPPAQTLAMGDGANDLAMLEAAGLGVACAAKPRVRERAWAWLCRGRLDDLLGLLSEA